MPKLSQLKKCERQLRLIDEYALRRKELKEIIKDLEKSPEERQEAAWQLARLPRDSNPNRYVNRCSLTGRPRAFYRKFGISRIMLRTLALKGEIPGVRKASW